MQSFSKNKYDICLNISEDDIISAQDICLAEESPVKSGLVLSFKKGFNYHLDATSSKVTDDLPPTSLVIRSHINRASFLITRTLRLLDDPRDQLDLQDYGWYQVSGVLLPSTCLKPLPPDPQVGITGIPNHGCKCALAQLSNREINCRPIII
jgi:hypothetical protein